MSVASVPQLLQVFQSWNEQRALIPGANELSVWASRLAAALTESEHERDELSRRRHPQSCSDAAERLSRADDDILALRAQREALRAAATKMVAKMDECATIIGSAFVCLQTSGYRNMASPAEYTGPTYNVELEALRAVLAQGEEP